MCVGKRIQEALYAAEMTQMELARLMEITPSAVSRWCSGECVPKDLHLSKIATILGVDYKYLKEGDKAEEEPAVSEETPDIMQAYVEMKAKAEIFEKLYYDLLERTIGR